MATPRRCTVLVMPITDHTVVLEHPWLAVAIALGAGTFTSQIAGVLSGGDLGFNPKAILAVGIACIVFGTMYYFAPAPSW